MENINANILLFAALMTVLILALASGVLMKFMPSSNREVKNRLNKYQARFSDKKINPVATRSIRKHASSGLGQVLTDYIPRQEHLINQLRKAGMTITLARFSAITAITTLVIILTVRVATDLPFILCLFIGILMGVGGAHMLVKQRIKRRIDKFTKLFPDALDMIVRGLKSGLPVGECLTNVSKEISDPIRTEFGLITDSIKLGSQIEDALWEASARLDTPDFKFFVISLSIQRETGGNLAETLGNLAKILRQRQTMKLKIKALSSEAKASAWILGLLPFIMFAMINTMNPEYGSVLYTDPAAILASGIGLVWMSIGVFVMARMIKFEV